MSDFLWTIQDRSKTGLGSNAEFTVLLTNSLKGFLFETNTPALQREIKKAIESLFKVKVTAVNTIRTLGKVKRFRGQLGKHREREIRAQRFGRVLQARRQPVDVCRDRGLTVVRRQPRTCRESSRQSAA